MAGSACETSDDCNTVTDGGTGYLAEGFVNLPLSEKAAVRLGGWGRHDAGYIDNVVGERTFPTSGICMTNARNPSPGCEQSPARAKDNYNDVDTYGARAALRIDLNDTWSVTPSVVYQRIMRAMSCPERTPPSAISGTFGPTASRICGSTATTECAASSWRPP